MPAYSTAPAYVHSSVNRETHVVRREYGSPLRDYVAVDLHVHLAGISPTVGDPQDEIVGGAVSVDVDGPISARAFGHYSAS